MAQSHQNYIMLLGGTFYIPQDLQFFGNINWFTLFGFLKYSCTIFLLYRYIYKIRKIIHTFLIIGNKYLALLHQYLFPRQIHHQVNLTEERHYRTQSKTNHTEARGWGELLFLIH